MERISKRITAFRQMEGLSQRQLARKAGISITTLGHAEQGHDITLKTIKKIETALGQSLF